MVCPHVKSESSAAIGDAIVRDLDIVGRTSLFIGYDTDSTILPSAVIYSVISYFDVVNGICLIVGFYVYRPWHVMMGGVDDLVIFDDDILAVDDRHTITVAAFIAVYPIIAYHNIHVACPFARVLIVAIVVHADSISPEVADGTVFYDASVHSDEAHRMAMLLIIIPFSSFVLYPERESLNLDVMDGIGNVIRLAINAQRASFSLGGEGGPFLSFQCNPGMVDPQMIGLVDFVGGLMHTDQQVHPFGKHDFFADL